MTKAELIARVAEQSGMTKKETAEILNLTLNTIVDTLSTGERVQLVGFGSFEVKQRAARMGRDMANGGGPIQLPPTKAVQFRAGKNLKELVSQL